MLIYLWFFLLLISGITIFIFHRKTVLYNKEQEKSPIWVPKDIWPYRVLWGIWSILLIISLLFRVDLPKFPSIHQWKDNNEIITKNDDEKKDTHPIYRQIIDQQRQEELTWSKNAIINPIIPWYYELITEDEKLIKWEWIVEWDYIIPQPINIAYCKAEDKYRNLWSSNGLSYNTFIYDYLNSQKKKDIVIWILDTGITKDNKKLSAHLMSNGKNVINQNDDTNDIIWHWSHVAWIILQTFPNAHILPIKVGDNDSETISKIDIIAWLRYAIDQNVDIINMSFWWNEKDEITSKLINEAVNKWILVIAAAWNESQNVTLYYPANYWWVTSVWSIWKIWKSDFSNYWADVEMPWECIYSTTTWWDFAFMDWTSMSAPHLAWIIWSYLSLDNKITQESEVTKLINENLQVWEWKSILNMPKLLDIENQNQKILENLTNIKSSLTDIENNLIALQWNLTEKWLNDTIHYIDKSKTSLEKNTKEIENIYKSLNINEWFWIELNKKIDDYINTLKNLLNKDSIQLISKDNLLWSSLWSSSCYETTKKCTNEDKKFGCNDTSYPWYICWSYDIIISWWVSLPAKWEYGYTTMRDYQDTLTFPIYQWDHEFEFWNKKLWEVTLTNIPKKLSWEASATIYFDVDKYWFLSVEAVDDSNWNNRAIKTKLTPTTTSVENKWDDYDKITTNINYALNETKDFINQIDKFNNVNPWDHISENSWEITNRIEHTTKITNNNEQNNIPEKDKNSNIPENIKVDKVIDWDTIRVFINWESTKVRLIWIDAPESNDTRYGYTECYGQASSNYLTNLLSNKTVWLEYDSSQWASDKYDRIIAYIFLNWENINKKIIEDGYAREYTYNLPYKYQSEFKQAESNAKQSKKWLWNKNTCNWEHKKWK